MPDLRLLGAFRLTRAFWPECPSLSAPAAGRTGHAGCRSSERGLHAPEGFLPFGARDGHVSPFSGLARWGGGFRGCLFGWVVPGRCVFSRAAGIGEIRLPSAGSGIGIGQFLLQQLSGINGVSINFCSSSSLATCKFSNDVI
ncbi:uncharacterized protein LOC133879776 [Alnus glutinosa]|uniref:uncharacterized protein LOC133879776 n=1 Tax=Alnus glutinosa TaxID=3517 RepID=UPI002D776F9B|nr:uncharacterized protein LOC133879776 [Alnus glutinosa]